jgi:hypothetical protein
MISRRIRGALAALTLLAGLLVAPARADDAAADDDAANGWKKVVAYAHCAVNVFRAVTATDWVVAFLDCTRLYLEESPAPTGGRP